jgi:cytochrome d ubiquinol oxidase subunit II
VIISAVAGAATLVLVYRRRFEPARYGAALAVAAVIVGWALARWPTILPGLTVDQAAAGHDTLVWVVVCVLGGAAILFPSLVLLFRLTLSGRLQAVETALPEHAAQRFGGAASPLLSRAAIACLIAGIGLLNLADARWAHAVGVGCLIGFVVLAIRTIIPAVLDEQPTSG